MFRPCCQEFKKMLSLTDLQLAEVKKLISFIILLVAIS